MYAFPFGITILIHRYRWSKIVHSNSWFKYVSQNKFIYRIYVFVHFIHKAHSQLNLIPLAHPIHSWAEALPVQIWIACASHPAAIAKPWVHKGFWWGTPTVGPPQALQIFGVWWSMGRCGNPWSLEIYFGEQASQYPSKVEGSFASLGGSFCVAAFLGAAALPIWSHLKLTTNLWCTFDQWVWKPGFYT